LGGRCPSCQVDGRDGGLQPRKCCGQVGCFVSGLRWPRRLRRRLRLRHGDSVLEWNAVLLVVWRRSLSVGTVKTTGGINTYKAAGGGSQQRSGKTTLAFVNTDVAIKRTSREVTSSAACVPEIHSHWSSQIYSLPKLMIVPQRIARSNKRLKLEKRQLTGKFTCVTW
jgi:hypothetical protein